jgi:ribosomal-protein-alanine N-acetyltransferase
MGEIPVIINEIQRTNERLETIHLNLTRPTDENILAVEHLWRNEQVRKFLGGTVGDEIINQKITELQNHWDLHKFGLWVVCKKTSDQIIGLCGLHYSEDGTEISYMFFPEFWGCGFASEAVKASITYGLKYLGIERIIAITQAENTKSCQLLHKVGMRFMSNFIRFNASQSLYEIKKCEGYQLPLKYENS